MSRKHDDAHRPLGGKGQRGNRRGTPANWGGAELITKTADALAKENEARAERIAAEYRAPKGQQ